VDAYFGPPELQEAPDSEPAQIAQEAAALKDELPDGWLRDQVYGVETTARVLAGEPIAYADEVERCYGVRPALAPPETYARAHAQLDRLLPGEGPVAGRLRRWEEDLHVAPERIGEIAEAVLDRARAWTNRVVALPEGERVEVEIVHGPPWLAFCHYQGDLLSHISINADLPIDASELLHLLLHEVYPGHHAERVCKDVALVREQGRLEETIVLVGTPQCLVMEGIAELGPPLVLDGPDGEGFAEIVRAHGVGLDLKQARAIAEARRPCGLADVDAALMLHSDGAGDDAILEHLMKQGLRTPEQAAKLLRFVREPSSRSYIVKIGRASCRERV